MKKQDELITDAIKTLIDALEIAGGQFLLEINGNEYKNAGFTKLDNEIIIHAFIEE